VSVPGGGATASPVNENQIASEFREHRGAGSGTACPCAKDCTCLPAGKPGTATEAPAGTDRQADEDDDPGRGRDKRREAHKDRRVASHFSCFSYFSHQWHPIFPTDAAVWELLCFSVSR
jgi:hypothetical protein